MTNSPDGCSAGSVEVGWNEDICLICWKPAPAAGWFFIGQSDEGPEYFCSEECFEENRK